MVKYGVQFPSILIGSLLIPQKCLNLDGEWDESFNVIDRAA